MTTKLVIHSMFEQVAASHVRYQTIRTTACAMNYRELNEAANRLAFHLHNQHGVRRASVVGLYLTMGINYVVGLLGVAKAGGIFLPLEPGIPPLRQEKFVAK